ncbi:hypothetical protein CBI38_15395 [Rhodococcus oxybenzonivorans]|uniref:AtuA-like ferredoxin-fold domain-containing protein n=1 Tax=Rhodococcus oxybenzonivorans TaxID=1990687 RepID=A0A2S2C450_9NOCA|nr:hypothetical protein [Rhodococcus oxybenzonivorans]AWK75574.1 hypothetical protein CBI38_15395 [Rhodococcus oxybenzonivorans]
MTRPATVQKIDTLADVRAGDKGDMLILAVLARDRAVAPNLMAMVFELPGVLGGGVTGSPALDGHGKTLGYHLLSLEI